MQLDLIIDIISSIASTIINALYTNIPSKVIEFKYKHQKSFRLIFICMGGIVVIMFVILFFAVLYMFLYKGKNVEHLSTNDYIFNSAIIYFTGNSLFNMRDLGGGIQVLFIIENFVSLMTNSIYLGIIVYHIFKTYNCIIMSKYLYIMNEEGEKNKYVLRFRVADTNNRFINYSYTIQFFSWFNDQFKDPYYEYSRTIQEMEYVYNEDIPIIERGKKKSKILEYVIEKFSNDNIDTNEQIICLTINATSIKNGETVIVKKKYNLKDVKFVLKCDDVFMWVKKHPTPRRWINLNRFTSMTSKEKSDLIMFLRKKNKSNTK